MWFVYGFQDGFWPHFPDSVNRFYVIPFEPKSSRTGAIEVGLALDDLLLGSIRTSLILLLQIQLQELRLCYNGLKKKKKWGCGSLEFLLETLCHSLLGIYQEKWLSYRCICDFKVTYLLQLLFGMFQAGSMEKWSLFVGGVFSWTFCWSLPLVVAPAYFRPSSNPLSCRSDDKDVFWDDEKPWMVNWTESDFWFHDPGRYFPLMNIYKWSHELWLIEMKRLNLR
jgi:hypothetical protein